jgi:hypothetical protein
MDEQPLYRVCPHRNVPAAFQPFLGMDTGGTDRFFDSAVERELFCGRRWHRGLAALASNWREATLGAAGRARRCGGGRLRNAQAARDGVVDQGGTDGKNKRPRTRRGLRPRQRAAPGGRLLHPRGCRGEPVRARYPDLAGNSSAAAGAPATPCRLAFNLALRVPQSRSFNCVADVTHARRAETVPQRASKRMEASFNIHSFERESA